MAKKGTRPTKTTQMNQQRMREEQWKRRIAAQNGSAGGVSTDEYAGSAGVGELDAGETAMSGTGTVPPIVSMANSVTRTMTTTSSASRTATVNRPPTPARPQPQPGMATSPASAAGSLGSTTAGSSGTAATISATAAQRRAASAARAARNRIVAAQGMSLDDEMGYVRSDVRRLVILTVFCVLVLIVLFLVIPK